MFRPACCSNLRPGVSDQVVEYDSEKSRTVASLALSRTLGEFLDKHFIFSHGGAPLRTLYSDIEQIYNQFGMASLTRLIGQGAWNFTGYRTQAGEPA